MMTVRSLDRLWEWEPSATVTNSKICTWLTIRCISPATPSNKLKNAKDSQRESMRKLNQSEGALFLKFLIRCRFRFYGKPRPIRKLLNLWSISMMSNCWLQPPLIRKWKYGQGRLAPSWTLCNKTIIRASRFPWHTTTLKIQLFTPLI